MGDLIDALGVDLTGLDPAPGPSRTILDNVNDLIQFTGSRRAAARVLGIGESTLRGWQAGAKPKRDPAIVAAAARGGAITRLRPGHYANAYSGQLKLKIRATIIASSDIRTRTINVGDYIPLVKVRNILRAWAQADDNRAERLLVRAIDLDYLQQEKHDPRQPGFTFGNVERVWFE